MARIGIIGDHHSDNETHIATDAALQDHDVEWIATDEVDDLSEFDGLFISPGSPYRSLEGALQAIRFARIEQLPLLGTCAGFQHIVIEFARNVLRRRGANHAEYDPDADDLFITPLSCSLVGQELSVTIEPHSIAGRAYADSLVHGQARERYYCDFGLNPEVEPALTAASLVISGRDADGEARVIELADHPFFVGTLFVPQASSTEHPLVTAFLTAAGETAA